MSHTFAYAETVGEMRWRIRGNYYMLQQKFTKKPLYSGRNPVQIPRSELIEWRDVTIGVDGQTIGLAMGMDITKVLKAGVNKE